MSRYKWHNIESADCYIQGYSLVTIQLVNAQRASHIQWYIVIVSLTDETILQTFGLSQGKNRKLSECHDPGVTMTKVDFPQENKIQVHQNRVSFPAGYYWYGNKRKGPADHRSG